MKKIIMLILFSVFITLFSSIGGAELVGENCGPSNPPEWCQNPTNCGAKECVSKYNFQEEAARNFCNNQKATCAIPTPTLKCGSPFDPLFIYTCQSSVGSFSSLCGDQNSCIQPCQNAVEERYQGFERLASDAGTNYFEGILDSGNFLEAFVPCKELDSCVDETAGVENRAFNSPERLDKCGLTEESIEKLLSKCNDPPNPNDLIGPTPALVVAIDTILQGATLDPSYCSVLEKHLDFSRPGDLEGANNINYHFRTEEGMYQATKGVNSNSKSLQTLLNNGQDPAFLNSERMVKITDFLGTEFTTETTFDMFLDKALGPAAGLFGLASVVLPLLFPPEGSTDDEKYIGIAQEDIYTAQGCTSQTPYTAAWKICEDPARVAACTGLNCIQDINGGASQCLPTLPDTTEVKFCSIHIIDNALNAMFTLTGFENYGVVYEETGFINIDDGGTTQIDVTNKEVPITDFKNNFLLLNGGTHYYYGTGTNDVDTYVINNGVLHINSNTAFSVTTDIDGDEFQSSLSDITGALTFKPAIGQLAISFNHLILPNYQNAVDLGKVSDGYLLLTRGFGDMALLGRNKVFPLVFRNFLKGNSAIVSNINVRITNVYLAADNVYDYVINSNSVSTKVTTKNEKVIQDSGGLPLALSPRQRSLVYG